jgi:DNA repair protein RadC
MPKNDPFTNIGLSRPARRALANAGISDLKKLSKSTVEEISALHGIGPAAVRKLKSILKVCK